MHKHSSNSIHTKLSFLMIRNIIKYQLIYSCLIDIKRAKKLISYKIPELLKLTTFITLEVKSITLKITITIYIHTCMNAVLTSHACVCVRVVS